MTQGLYIWSKTAATNGSVDASINMAEGMSPSAVNDSCRAMMARVAEKRDDVAGQLTSGGTSTAYTLATNEVFDSLVHMDKQEITFVPNVTSGASPTLAVDGLTAAPLQSASGTAIPTGALIAGTPYRFTYYNSAPAFILQGAVGVLPNGTVPVSALIFASGPALAGSTGAGNGSTLTIGIGFNINGTTLNVATPPQASFKNLSVKVTDNTHATLAADFISVTDGTNYQTLAFNQAINLGTTGANALDTGTIAIDTWYAIWAIAKSDGTVGGLASTSFSAPTMPSGYTFKARVGAVQTIHASATLYGTWQLGRRAQYIVGLAQTAATPIIASGAIGTYDLTSPTLAATTVVGNGKFVPTTASSIRVVAFTEYKSGTNGRILIAPSAAYSGTNNGPVGSNGMIFPFVWDGAAAATSSAGVVEMLLESNSIYLASNNSGPGIGCFGWEDNI